MPRLTVLLLVCAALLGGLYAWDVPPFGEKPESQDEESVDAGGGRVESTDGSAVIHVPRGAAVDGTRVRFRSAPTDEITNARAVRSIGPAVDVQVISGKLLPKKTDITLAYDPSQLPEKFGPEQVSIAVYQPELGGWVTATDHVTVNGEDHTVTLHHAPHYSRYAPVSLDPAKAVLKFGRTMVHTTIDASTTVASWTREAVSKYGAQLIRDLYGIADPLRCDAPSEDLTVKTRATLRVTLEACVNEEQQESVLKLRNGTALPLRGDVPVGMDVNWRRLLASHDDFGQFMQSLAWMPLGQTTVSNASLSDLVVTKAMKSRSTYSVSMDEIGWAVDMGIAALSVVQPQVKGLDVAKKEFVDDMREATLQSASKGKLIDGWNKALAKRREAMKNAKLASAQAQFATAMGFINCMTGAASNSDRSPMAGVRNVKELNSKGVKILQGCLNAVLGELELDHMLKAVIGSAKIVPEFLQGRWAMQLRPIIDAGTASATVSRFDKQEELRRFVGRWQAHGVTMTIHADGTGKYGYRTYSVCDEVRAGYACDYHSDGRVGPGGELTFTLDVTGPNRVHMVVKTSNSPAEHRVGSRIPMRFTEPGVIGYGKEAFNEHPTFGSPSFDEVCEKTKADAGRCGA